jgi:hypothetical protein
MFRSMTIIRELVLSLAEVMLHKCIRRAQVKVGLRLERRYSQRWNFVISAGDGSVCQEKFGIHSIAAVCC